MIKKIKSREAVESFGEKILSQIKKGKNPEIEMTLRSLNNIIYDKKKKILRLGDKKSSRSFFNVAHSKKFLQTVEIASIINRELIKSVVLRSILSLSSMGTFFAFGL